MAYVELGKGRPSTLYKLAVVTPDDHQIAIFNGDGPVERDLIKGITDGIMATLPQAIADALTAQKSWWKATSVATVRETIAHEAPNVIADALNTLLTEIKRDALSKHFGG